MKAQVKYDVPFVPSSDDSVSTMVKMTAIKKDDKAVDLGSGDGKLVIAMAKAGALAVGVEIDEERWILANRLIAAEGLVNRARVVRGSFWRHNLSCYDVIALYGIPSIMERMKYKILNEAKDSVRVVSNHFAFPDWKPVKTIDSIHLYKPFD